MQVLCFCLFGVLSIPYIWFGYFLLTDQILRARIASEANNAHPKQSLWTGYLLCWLLSPALLIACLLDYFEK
jgi:hypothetical protein